MRNIGQSMPILMLKMRLPIRSMMLHRRWKRLGKVGASGSGVGLGMGRNNGRFKMGMQGPIKAWGGLGSQFGVAP